MPARAEATVEEPNPFSLPERWPKRRRRRKRVESLAQELCKYLLPLTPPRLLPLRSLSSRTGLRRIRLAVPHGAAVQEKGNSLRATSGGWIGWRRATYRALLFPWKTTLNFEGKSWQQTRVLSTITASDAWTRLVWGETLAKSIDTLTPQT